MTKLRAVLQRRWYLLVIGLLVGASAGFMSTSLTTQNKQKLYTARQVIVANVGSGAVSLVSQDTLTVTRGKVPAEAAKRLGRPGSADALAALIDAKFDPKTSSISVTTDDKQPKAAAERVDAFVQSFLEVTNSRLQAGDREKVAQLQDNVAAAEKERDDFVAQYPEIARPGFTIGSNDVYYSQILQTKAALDKRVLDAKDEQRKLELALLRNLPYATLGPETPRPAESGLIEVPASRTARAAIIGLFGLALAGGLVMLMERLGRRIDTRDELVEITDLPILAEIGFVPQRRRSVDSTGRVSLSGVWAEPYRRVRSAIQFVQANGPSTGWTPPPGSPSHEFGAPPSVFLVTSTSPAEGKSTTSSLVALALAEVGVPTLLVGGDFRKPQVDRLMGVEQEPSLQDMATLDLDRATVDEVVQTTEFDNLYVAAAGRPTREVAGLVEAARLVSREAVRRGATVIIDSSPLQAANDTLDLLPSVDYVIIVLRVGRSTETDLLDTIATLRRMDSNLLGIVLIGTPAGRRQEYYYDYYSTQEAKAVAGVVPGEPPADQADEAPVENAPSGSPVG